MNIPSKMSGFGCKVPDGIISNEHVEHKTTLTDEWIISRTGISTRHVLGQGETGTDLALAASLDALRNTALTPQDITHIIYATCTPDACCPSAACTLAAKLGISGIMAVDINAACAGFVNGMELAAGLVSRTPKAKVLLVASESLSHRCNWDDPGTAILFGDGAGAVIVDSSSEPANTPSAVIDDISIGSEGARGDLLHITGGYSATPYALGETVGPEYFIRMNGGLVFKQAVRRMSACCLELLEKNGLTPDDVDLFVPHQANLRIIEAVGNRLGISGERVFLNVQKYGNTSAASIPIALAEAAQQGCLGPGMRILVTTFGGGLTWGAALLHTPN